MFPILTFALALMPLPKMINHQNALLCQKTETPQNYRPWYSTRFSSIDEIATYWSSQYDNLKNKTELFTNTFYDTTLPAEIIDAVAPISPSCPNHRLSCANTMAAYGIMKDGDTQKFLPWFLYTCMELCKAIPHLFPAMERTLRESEFFISQNKEGHQMFRTNIPIRAVKHDFSCSSRRTIG